MATLVATEQVKIRNAVARKAEQGDIAIRWTKAAIGDAAQAVEDLLVNNATAINNAIDAAASPYGVTFTATEKKWLVAVTLLSKYNRDIA